MYIEGLYESPVGNTGLTTQYSRVGEADRNQKKEIAIVR